MVHIRHLSDIRCIELFLNRFHFRIRPFFKYWDDSAGFPKNNQSIFMIQKFR